MIYSTIVFTKCNISNMIKFNIINFLEPSPQEFNLYSATTIWSEQPNTWTEQKREGGTFFNVKSIHTANYILITWKYLQEDQKEKEGK